MIRTSTWICSIFLAACVGFEFVPPRIAISDEPLAPDAKKEVIEFRTWTSKDGRTSELALIAIEEGTVVMRDRAGKQFRLEIARFSDADKQRIEGTRTAFSATPEASDPKKSAAVSPRSGPWKTKSNLGEAQSILAKLDDNTTVLLQKFTAQPVTVTFTISDDGKSISRVQVFGAASTGGGQGIAFLNKFPTPIEIKNGKFSSTVGSSVFRGKFIEPTKVEGFARIVTKHDSQELVAAGEFVGGFQDVAGEEADRALRTARSLLAANPERGRDRLRELIRKWPGTEAAATAKKLLETR